MSHSPHTPLNALLFSTEQELEPQDWCCRWNDQPYFCALYQQRRPRISCAGYRPPRPGEAAGACPGADPKQRIWGGGAPSWGLDKGSTRFLGGTVAIREGGDGSGIRCMANRGALYMVLGKG